MPIILDPTLPQAELPREVVSTDGRLTAWVDRENNGVLLRYRTDNDQAHRVVVVRYSNGETVIVRSAGAALTPGGTGFAYDAEPGLGAAILYRATPIHFDGTEGESSVLALEAAGGLDTPRSLPQVWLTSTADAERTMSVRVKELPDLDYDIDQDSAAVLGASTPIVVSAPTSAPTFDITLISLAKPTRDKLAELLRLPGYGQDGMPPPTVLLRWEVTSYQRHDTYAVVSKVSESAPSHALARTRELELGLTTVARPDPSGAPLRIPGVSYAGLLAERPSYADVAETGSYADLLHHKGT